MATTFTVDDVGESTEAGLMKAKPALDGLTTVGLPLMPLALALKKAPPMTKFCGVQFGTGPVSPVFVALSKTRTGTIG